MSAIGCRECLDAAQILHQVTSAGGFTLRLAAPSLYETCMQIMFIILYSSHTGEHAKILGYKGDLTVLLTRVAAFHSVG